MGDDDQWLTSSSCKLCTASANLSRRQPFQTSKTGDSNGPVYDSGPNDRQTTKRDRPETLIPWPVMAPAAVIVNPVNFSSSISLRLCLLIGYYVDATKTVFPGTGSSLPPREEKHQIRSIPAA